MRIVDRKGPGLLVSERSRTGIDIRHGAAK